MLVSICCLSYNHEKFIRDALDSILKQKVNFEYEILIHDDASTDRSQEIIKEYEKKYPNIIKPIYQTENQYSKGGPIDPDNFNRAKGKYLAFCECDDYWIDENKLQKQIDFLENHPEYMGTSHNIYVVDKNKNIKNLNNETRPSLEEHDIVSLNELKYNLGICGQTATLVCRNFWAMLSDKQKSIYCESKINGDRKINICLVHFGKVKYFADVMSAYRITYDTDSWTSQNAHRITPLFIYENEKRLQQFAFDAFGENFEFDYIGILADACVRFIRRPNFQNLKIIKELWFKEDDKKIYSMSKALIEALNIILVKLKLKEKNGYWKIIPKVPIEEKKECKNN